MGLRYCEDFGYAILREIGLLVFVSVLTDANARLGADVDRYSFIVVDLHHLLLAGLPAHFESYMPQPRSRSLWRVYPVHGLCEQRRSGIEQAPRMKMLEGRKDFRAQVPRVVPQFSQRGVDPRKHARSRPMRLNIRRPFGHGGHLVRLKERTSAASERKVASRARRCGLFRAVAFSIPVRASGSDQARPPWRTQ